MWDDYYKLDNPAWYALAETHAGFAIGNDKVKRYHPDIVAFVAYRQGIENICTHLDEIIGVNESFFIIGEMSSLASNYIVESILPCTQMICSKRIQTPETVTIEKLRDTDDEDILALINLVQPGYYKKGTRLMGDYFGIRQDAKLVSLTGERMRMNGLTEISAVVTHPDFTGRKYAQQLVAHAGNKNFDEGIIPFLHVAATNERAINIYELLGFVKRRNIDFTRLKRVR
jgi:predicted GNAT family acetyltransferase